MGRPAKNVPTNLSELRKMNHCQAIKAGLAKAINKSRFNPPWEREVRAPAA
jgi:hypothetical protein